jgi:hypothetical protein
MSKRKHREQGESSQQDDEETVAPATQAPTLGYDAWNTSAFRNAVLIDLVFVALPAIIMAAVGQRVMAAAWFGVGFLVIIWQFWRQIRDFWRAMRSGNMSEQEGAGERGGEQG